MTRPDTTALGLAPALGPTGEPEAFAWAVQFRDGSALAEMDPASGRQHTFSVDVDASQVRWLFLLPQYPSLHVHRVRVPAGAQAWFARSRAHLVSPEGLSTFEPRFGTGIGWRAPDGSGPTLIVCRDGSTVFGEDHTSLLEALSH